MPTNRNETHWFATFWNAISFEPNDYRISSYVAMTK